MSILRVVTLHLYVSFHPLLLFYVVVNDGLVSTFLLVAGVAGGGLATTDILLTAIAGALAGAVSMCAGEYVATKSQDEVLRGEIKLENEHIQKYRSDELLELSELL